MSSLIFESLEVKGFRGFEQLQLKRLGRINLIVGKNNVGKSSLLEALALYASQGAPQAILELLSSRNEIQQDTRKQPEEEEIEAMLAIRHLFHGRPTIGSENSLIEIGVINSVENRLTITAGWYALETNQQGRSELFPLEDEEYNKVNNPVVGITIQKGTQEEIVHRFTRRRFFTRRGLIDRTLSLQLSEKQGLRSIFIPANALTERQIGRLWEKIALTKFEDKVLEMLWIVKKEIERVSLIGFGGSQPFPIVRIKGVDEPVPLQSLGEGLNRILGIALALVNATNGLLLIDEIASGLHYSVQIGLWRFILAMADDLNVQVFATTHSNDCILAFQEAANEFPELEESLLIRLENRQERIVPILFDQRRLAIAAQQEIEVR